MTDRLVGFTPIMDDLVEVYNRECAAVYGAIWRFTQMKSGKCTASQTKIGKRIGLNRQTVNKHIQTLIADGYICDETPDIKHKSHVYSLLIEPSIGISMGVRKEDTSSKEGVRLEDTSGVRPTDTKIDKNKIPQEQDTKDSRSKKNERGKRPPNYKAIHKRHCIYFAEISGHEVPEPITARERSSAVTIWWNPIDQIMKKVKYHEADGMALVQEAHGRLTKNGMTIKGPISLLGTCDAIIAEVRRGQFKPSGLTNAEISARWMAERQAEERHGQR